eukprot:TRINITY_DN13760_c0_g3_i1.p1 TRINITY_DN13760_c0_g3~~TRINITY_DN13760_c0_g3_i1.p1  ORF type:complete len:236 (+),score=19.00 TRINITY_DN13760_c0_g3_i1:37-708(+)
MDTCLTALRSALGFVAFLNAADIGHLLSVCKALEGVGSIMLSARSLPIDLPLRVIHFAGDPPGRLRVVGERPGSVGFCEYQLCDHLVNGFACFRSAGMPTMVFKHGRGHCRAYCYIWWQSGWRITVNDVPPPRKGELIGRLDKAPWKEACGVDMKQDRAGSAGWSHTAMDGHARVYVPRGGSRPRESCGAHGSRQAWKLASCCFLDPPGACFAHVGSPSSLRS